MKSPQQKHQWPRYWIPFDSDVSLDYDGFPVDPEGEFARYYSSSHMLASFAEVPALVLLGEPGIGKSTALAEEHDRLKNAGVAVFYRELNRYQTDTALISDLFHNQQIQEWRSHPDTQLVFLLDSLDECQLFIHRAARIIAGELEKLPLERLKFRITCRVADWPEEMTKALNGLWPTPQGNEVSLVQRLSLVPLRCKDVVQAATDRGLDASSFLEEVRRVDIASFASHPHTLNMLLDIYRDRSSLPARRAEIFEQGCLYLVTENSRSRKSDGHRGEVEPALRLPIAGRIAALMLFSQKNAVLREDLVQVGNNALSITDVYGGEESGNGLKQRVDEQAVRDVLDTTLFSGRGEHRLGFVHQSHMEFLAAWYLKKRGLDAERLLRLLRFAEDGHVPPQLGELAGWLAEMDSAVFTALAGSDPLILLRSDSAALKDEQKAVLVDKLLDAIARREASDWDWELRKHYPKLNHPELAGQLETFLLDSSRPVAARETAIEIASANRLSAMGKQFIELALNSDEPIRIRKEAVQAATMLVDKAELGKLRPLIFEENFKSLLARALWPEHVSTQEMFDFIATAKSMRVLGNEQYQPESWVELFPVEDMRVALAWVRDADKSSAYHNLHNFKDVVMARAWAMFQDEAEMRESFAETVWVCLQRYESIFNREGRGQEPAQTQPSFQHQSLLELLLARAMRQANEDAEFLLPRGFGEFLRAESIAPWLLAMYRETNELSSRKIIAHCIRGSLGYQSSSTLLDEVIAASCEDILHDESPLADAVSFLSEPWWLDDEWIQGIRERYFQRQNVKPCLSPPPAQRVESALKEYESGRKDAWMRLWPELDQEDSAVGYSWHHEIICDMPGWKRLSPQDNFRVRQCALGWLDSQTLTESDLYLGNSYSYRHISTCLALDLLIRQDKENLRQFSSERWREWGPAVVRYRFGNAKEARESLLRLGFELAPDAMLATFRRELEREIFEGGPLSKRYELNSLWDGRVVAMLHELLEQTELKPNQREDLLDTLMEHGDPLAIEEALHLFAAAGGDDLLRYAHLLLSHVDSEIWPALWARMEKDEHFGKEFVLRAASLGYSFAFLNKLDEPQLAKLYVWLETHFPQAEDIPHPEGVYTPTSRDDVAHLRSNCVSHLANRGTQVALAELHVICMRFPDYDWLWRQYVKAREKNRELSWRPIPPGELLDFLQRADSRLVRNADELAEAVMASLRRFQAKLKGETPLAPFLWNMDDKENQGRPKGEDRMSDFVLHHLRDDLPLLVVNREVQVQNLNETGIGERVDLKVETRDAEGNPLTLIVESKGCWNKELLTAMESQLHDRYMKQTHAEVGIYLVGWFVCERWKNGPKKAACQKHASLDALRETLIRQASNLSGVRVFVLDAIY